MPYQVDVRSIFNPAAVGRTMKQLKDEAPLRTFMLDAVFKSQIPHPFPVLGIDQIQSLTGNVPLVMRGGSPVPLSSKAKATAMFEIPPVKVSARAESFEMNNLRLVGGDGIEQWRTQKINQARRAVRATREALAIQAVNNGILQYPIKTDGGLDVWTLDYQATPLDYTVSAKWDTGDATAATVLENLIEMSEMVAEASGYGGVMKYLAGKKVFTALANIAVESKAKQAGLDAKVTESGIQLAGFVVELARGGYRNLQSQALVPAVEENTLLAIGVDAPHTEYFCSIDNLNAGNRPLPFFVQAVPDRFGDGFDIVAQAKPVPVPVMKAIAKTQATTPS